MSRATLFLLSGGAALIVAGCASSVPTPPTIAVNTGVPAVAVDSLGQLVSNYKKWSKVNATPIHMEPYVSASCVESVTWESVNDPHDRKFFTVYVNDIGRAAMLSKEKTTFPLGSIIVKEKLPSITSTDVELMTVMVKRRKGFDTENGDWEYFTTKGAGPEISQDNVAMCQSCHMSVKKNDFVFRDHYVAGAPRVKPTDLKGRATRGVSGQQGAMPQFDF